MNFAVYVRLCWANFPIGRKRKISILYSDWPASISVNIHESHPFYWTRDTVWANGALFSYKKDEFREKKKDVKGRYNWVSWHIGNIVYWGARYTEAISRTWHKVFLDLKISLLKIIKKRQSLITLKLSRQLIEHSAAKLGDEKWDVYEQAWGLIKDI